VAQRGTDLPGNLLRQRILHRQQIACRQLPGGSLEVGGSLDVGGGSLDVGGGSLEVVGGSLDVVGGSLDVVGGSLDVVGGSLSGVTPGVYGTLEDCLGRKFGTAYRLPTFFRWGTWVGGDRDGNPNVTAIVTRIALQRQQATVVTRYLHDVEALGRSLSISSLRARPGSFDELMQSIEHDRERFPEVAAHARPRTVNEPWRESLWHIECALRRTPDPASPG